MSRNNGRLITDNLVPSTPDDVELGRAVEVRTTDMAALYLRVIRKKLIGDKDITNALIRFRSMRIRHNKGDLRHTRSEKNATKAIAQWSLDINNMLRKQPRYVIAWKD